ncbi:phrenate dehydratase [Schizosaccharomyces japonicus yFS275]|uniref:Phrenate dehydratase n=1 Tax=Schizosaccharomyces japonicus (strain yFS275 / FY16936) TaxID=402676 RepID=B6K3E0_SCHJY|nr:phrenate dehydratase [Schizosaccharomyces japonicus yFS275]EEB07997.1 phrenate dehydratase [Schizosaccharomyces japonicus yFS275]
MEYPTIGFLGPEGTFSEKAARLVTKDAIRIPEKSFEAALKELDKGSIDYFVLPIENSTNGAVVPAYDLLRNNEDIWIQREVLVPAHQCVLGRDLQHITAVLSHPQVFGQCASWLRTFAPHAELVSCSSTSKAAHIVSSDTAGTSIAIAGELCAEKYNIKLLARNVEDDVENKTRFLVLSKRNNKSKTLIPPNGHPQQVKVMLRLTPNDPSEMNSVLTFFTQQSVPILNITQRPSLVKRWNYTYFIECMNFTESQALELSRLCSNTTVLGVYRNEVPF